MTQPQTFRTRREADAHIATMRGWDAVRAVKLDMSGAYHWDAQGSGDYHAAGPDGRYPRGCHCLPAAARVNGPWVIEVGPGRYLYDDGFVG